MEIMEKTKLFKSEFYKGMERTIHDWDDALGKDREDAAVMRKLSWCLAQWEVYRKAIKFIYGTEYHFSRTDEYFGLCDEDGKDWLLYVEREPATCQCIQKVREYGIKCNEAEYYNEEFVELYLGEEVRVIETEKTVKVRDMQGNKIIHFPKLPVEKVKGSVWNPQNRAALEKALWETLEMVLESELFTNAAQRGLEDYEFIVSSNISTMVDSVLGKYEQIIHMENENDWLMKVDREQVKFPQYHASAEDIKEAMRRTREVQRIAREYKSDIPDQSKTDAMGLVLGRAEKLGKITL